MQLTDIRPPPRQEQTNQPIEHTVEELNDEISVNEIQENIGDIVNKSNDENTMNASGKLEDANERTIKEPNKKDTISEVVELEASVRYTVEEPIAENVRKNSVKYTVEEVIEEDVLKDLRYTVEELTLVVQKIRLPPTDSLPHHGTPSLLSPQSKSQM